MQICSLASGSKGNCIVVANNNRAVLVDCGLSTKDVFLRMKMIGLDPKALEAIFITHEHIDHIKGAMSIANELKIKVFANELTAVAMTKKIGDKCDICVDFNEGAECAGMFLKPFRVPHDATYTVGYRVFDGVKSLGIATDLGQVTDGVMRNLGGCDAVLIESNHDLQMLHGGRYPQRLKTRILSANGHLSNDQCAEAVANLVKSGAKKIILGHLSEDNNHPEIAFSTTSSYLASKKILEGKDVKVHIALQKMPTSIIEI